MKTSLLPTDSITQIDPTDNNHMPSTETISAHLLNSPNENTQSQCVLNNHPNTGVSKIGKPSTYVFPMQRLRCCDKDKQSLTRYVNKPTVSS